MNLPWPLIVLVGVLVVAGLALFRSGSRAGTDAGEPPRDLPPETIFRDDDRRWFGNILYNNPDDPDIFVRKRFGLGHTVNIGRPLGKLILLGTLLVPVVLAVLKAISRH